MATVTSLDKVTLDAIIDSMLVDAELDGNGHLILKSSDGTPHDVGSVKGDRGVGPTGTMMEFGGDIVPTGWALCDGSEVSRTDFASLFAIIGTKYGAGDGFSTFNLPDRRGRMGVGKDPSNSRFDELGKVGGEEEVTLTENEMPSHNHAQNPHNHTQNSHNHDQNAHDHGMSAHNHDQSAHDHDSRASGHQFTALGSPANDTHGNLSGSGRLSASSTNGQSAYHSSTASTDPSISSVTTNPHANTATNQATTATNNATTATNQPTGGDEAHENMPPFMVVNFIIKT